MHETGDAFRDTVALTVRGDGVDIPPFSSFTPTRTPPNAAEDAALAMSSLSRA